MTYAFPPPPPISNTVLGLLLAALFGALLLPLVRMVLRRGRPNRWDGAVVLGMVLWVVFVMAYVELNTTVPFYEGRDDLLSAVGATMLVVVVTAIVWGIALTQSASRVVECGVWLATFVVLANITFAHYSFSCHVSASRMVQCRNNLKQIGLALHNDNDARGTFVPAMIEENGQPPRSWRVELLPYLDQRPLRETYDEGSAWNAKSNAPIAQQRVCHFHCPSNPIPKDAAGQWFSAYAGVTGPGAFFPEAGPLAVKDVTDGLSNTLAVVEACGQKIVWTEPRDVDLATMAVGINLPGTQPGRSDGILSAHHRSGVHAAFADGSVKMLNAKTDPAVLRALLTATGGELTPSGF